MLGAIFVILWVITILRYWPRSTSAKFFVKPAMKYFLWLPFGLCCIVAAMTFPTRGVPLIMVSGLVRMGVLAGIAALIGHAILEVAYLRKKANAADT